jgi:uncharacterized protein DUF3455
MERRAESAEPCGPFFRTHGKSLHQDSVGNRIFVLCRVLVYSPQVGHLFTGAQEDDFDRHPKDVRTLEDGKRFGKHFARPSWETQDNSRVTGKAVANAPSPDADSIPWLLVHIVGHEDAGVLSRATTIQRLNTKGGKAPATGCDASPAGREVRVAYSADYLFYAPK